MEQLGLLALNGLSWGMTVFLAAAGLTLIFGILHILNFAHGGFVMIGAYLAYSLMALFGSPTLWSLALSTAGAAVLLGIGGALLDATVFAKLRGVSESYSLIATYALLLLSQGLVKLVWGVDVLSVSPPPELRGAIDVGGVYVPHFVLFVLACGLAVFVMLEALIHRTNIGKTVQSVAVDPWMAALLGINVRLVLVGTVAVGVALAGVAGAILSLNQSLSPDMGGALVIQAFGVIVIGGMGSIRGAFFAALVLGIVVAIGDRYVAELPGLFFYVALILILMLRPQGLGKGLR
jgi:branched-chain amino acid transport system permease protein